MQEGTRESFVETRVYYGGGVKLACCCSWLACQTAQMRRRSQTPRLVDLRNSSSIRHASGGIETDRIWTVASHFADGGAFDLLVDASGQVVGSVGLCRVSNSTCELRKMYLAPEVRGCLKFILSCKGREKRLGAPTGAPYTLSNIRRSLR